VSTHHQHHPHHPHIQPTLHNQLAKFFSFFAGSKKKGVYSSERAYEFALSKPDTKKTGVYSSERAYEFALSKPETKELKFEVTLAPKWAFKLGRISDLGRISNLMGIS